MQEFVFVYRLPEDYVPGSEATHAAWRSWFESMGADLLDVGKPATNAATVGRCGDGVRLAGFSVIAAENREKALELAGRCPALRCEGGVEVAELLELPDASQALEGRND
jgi:hypothetical protein